MFENIGHGYFQGRPATGAAILCLLLGVTDVAYFTLPFALATWLALMACRHAAKSLSPSMKTSPASASQKQRLAVIEDLPRPRC